MERYRDGDNEINYLEENEKKFLTLPLGHPLR